MRLDESQDKDNGGDEKSSSSKKVNAKTKKSPRKSVTTPRKKSGADKKTMPQTNVRRSGRFNQISDEEEEEEEEDESEDESDDDYKDEENSNDRVADTEDDIPMADGTSPTSAPTAPPSPDDSENERDMSTFPVVITTYEMIIRDRAHLAHYNWGYIVVDEGHRLKNLDCKLMQEIKKYPSAGRMILTGTPLHVSLSPPSFCFSLNSDDSQNNLAELWSLLNFILPDIFEDLDAFQEWYVALGTITLLMFTNIQFQVQFRHDAKSPLLRAFFPHSTLPARNTETLPPAPSQSRCGNFPSSEEGICPLRATE